MMNWIINAYKRGIVKWWAAFMAADGLMIVIIIYLLFFS
jgi:hypothetical protein